MGSQICQYFEVRTTLTNSATEAPTAHTSPEARGGGGKRARQEIRDELHALVVKRESVHWSHNEPAPYPSSSSFHVATQVDKSHVWVRYVTHVHIQVVVRRTVLQEP